MNIGAYTGRVQSRETHQSGDLSFLTDKKIRFLEMANFRGIRFSYQVSLSSGFEKMKR